MRVGKIITRRTPLNDDLSKQSTTETTFSTRKRLFGTLGALSGLVLAGVGLVRSAGASDDQKPNTPLTEQNPKVVKTEAGKKIFDDEIKTINSKLEPYVDKQYLDDLPEEIIDLVKK